MRSQKPTVLGSSLLAAAIAACSQQGSASGSDVETKGSAAQPGPTVSAPAPSVPPPGGPSKTGEKDDEKTEEQAELKILRFALTSNVRDKEPVDKLSSAKPGQRIWAHLAVRNRTGFSREIDLVFKVAGKERTRVSLTIENSWSFRTWGYVTLKPTDIKGDVSVSIVNDSGDSLGELKIPIQGK